MSVIGYILRFLLFFVGLMLHALFPSDIIMVAIGAVMMLASTCYLFNNKEERIFEAPEHASKSEGWVPFPEDKLAELLSLIPPKEYAAHGGSINNFNDSLWVQVVVGIAATIVSVVGNFILFDSVEHFAIVFDIIVVIFTFIEFSGGITSDNPMAIQVPALSAMRDMELPPGFKKQFEAQIVKDKNGDPDILSARLQIKPEKRIKGLLCIMMTISRTKVEESVYPYVYGVLVFKGESMSKQSLRAASQLSEVTTDTMFKIETSSSYDDSTRTRNTVCVILPKYSTQYTTKFMDCVVLCEIMSICCKIIEYNRDEIDLLS